MPFSPDELTRYGAQIALPAIGGAGQQRLQRARVLVVGAGGLGCPALVYLAGAGIGVIGIVDYDTVSLSNLHRQFLYQSADVGQLKTECAARALSALNPHVTIIPHTQRLTSENAAQLIDGYTHILDACDNHATRLALSCVCHAQKKPLIIGALQGWQGYVTCLKPYETDNTGRFYPTYEAFFAEITQTAPLPCAQMGLFGGVAGVIGSLQSCEIVKEIIGTGSSLTGIFLLYDAWKQRMTRIGHR